jgi:hypothetical protein
LQLEGCHKQHIKNIHIWIASKYRIYFQWLVITLTGLGQEGIHSDHPTVEDQALYDGLDGCDFIGFVVHGVLGERHAHMVRQRREQMGPRRPLFFGTASCFPVQGSCGPGTSGALGRLLTTLSARVPRCASHASRSTCRKMVWSVAAQGVAWVKPSAWAIRALSLRPHSAMAL